MVVLRWSYQQPMPQPEPANIELAVVKFLFGRVSFFIVVSFLWFDVLYLATTVPICNIL